MQKNTHPSARSSLAVAAAPLLQFCLLLLTTTTIYATTNEHPSSPSFVSPVTGSRLHWNTPLSLLPVLQSNTTRQLAVGDFESLNSLFDGAVIDVPGEFPKDDLLITDLQCSHLTVGDLIVEATEEGNTNSPTLPLVTNLRLSVVDLTFDCTCRYSYDVPVIPNDIKGSITFVSRDSDIQTDIALTSSRQDLMVTAETRDCNAQVGIGEVRLGDTDFLGPIGDMFEKVGNLANKLVLGLVKDKLNQVVCNEMKSIGQEALPELLNQLSDGMAPYVLPVQPITVDPLQTEQQILAETTPTTTKPTTPYFINFQEKDADSDASDLSHLVLNALDELDAYLASKSGPSNELAINTFLRQNLLDDTGAFAWGEDNSLPQTATSKQSVELLTSHDDLLQLSVTLNQISIRGLDSMTHFDTLQRIGKHTLQNNMGWKYLSGTADLTIEITPSTLDTSLWETTKPNLSVKENIQINLQADDIQAAVSLFAAIHQDRLGQVPLGALFQSDAIVSCLMSTLYSGELVSGFSVEVSNLVDPTVAGFTSLGLDRVLTEVLDLMYDLYEHWVIKALPNFAQTKVRGTVNELWMDALDDLSTPACPLFEIPSQQDGMTPFVDFRDLLLPPEQAKSMGGTGQEPYGDVVSTVLELVKDELLVVDESDPNKRLILNSLLLDPTTKAQSGEAGKLHFTEPLVSFAVGKDESTSSSSMVEEIAASLFDSMELQVYNAVIQNIATVVEPTSLLQTGDDPFLIKNLLQFGPIEGQLLNASVQVRMAVDPFDKEKLLLETPEADLVEHIMELSMSASSLQLVADLVAKVDARKLQEFHLQDILNAHCWLATIPPPEMNDNGRPLVRPGLVLDAFLPDFMDLAMDIRCLDEECGKAGIGVLTELNEIWKQNNVTTTLGERFELMAIDLMTGDYADAQVARWLDEAPSKCPHNENYNSASKAYPSLGLPLFSETTIDTMIFTALTAAQAGLLLMSEVDPTLLGMPSSIASKAPAPQATNSDKLIDFTSHDGIGSLSDLVTFMFSQASELLGVKQGDSGLDTGINSIIEGMLNQEGMLDLPFSGQDILDTSNLQLRLNSVRVGGLDSFSHFSVLDALGPQTLQNKLRLERLSVEIDMNIISSFEQTTSSKRIVLAFGAEDIDVSLPIYAAINAEKLDALELGSLLEIKNILSCIFTAVEDMSIPSVDLKIGSLSGFSLDGLLPATSTAFSRSMASIQNQFNLEIDGMLNPILQGVLNGVLSSWRKNAFCDNIMLSSSRRRTQESSGFIDFRDLFLREQESLASGGSGQSPYGDLFRTVLSFVEDLILDSDPVTGLASVNDLVVAPLTRAISNSSGSVIMPGPIVDIMNSIAVGGFDATLMFRASEVRIDNLDTLRDPIALLSPIKNEPYLLNNTASMGLPDVRPLGASVRLLFGLEDGDDLEMRNDLELAMNMQDVSAVLTALLKVVEDQFATFPLGDILNLDCWLAKVPASPLDEFGFRQPGSKPSLSLSELSAAVNRINLRIKCFSCTSGDLEDWNTEGSKDIETVTDRVVNYVTDVLGGKFLQVQIDRALSHAAKRCPHSPEFDPNFGTPEYKTFESDHDESSTTFLLMLLIVTGLLFVALALIVIFVRGFVRVRHRRLLKSLPDRQIYLLQKEQKKEDKRERELNAVTHSLFQSSATIPVYVRYLIPIVIFANIGFFLSGHLSLGASVNIDVQLAGESFTIENFFSFSMARSTIDIWNAGGRALAAMIFIFSGLWPYTKQIITLVLWFTPPSKVSMARRESMLLWLDILAKWSMVDIFVMLVSLAGFRVSIVSPELDFLPENFYSIDLMVVPVWGLYANMIAQIMSQISSHFIIHYHRKVVAKASRARRALFRRTAGLLEENLEETTATGGFLDDRGSASSSTGSESEDTEDLVRKDKLCEHAFVRPHSNNSKLVARGFMNPLLVVAAVGLGVLLITGCVLPSFSLEVMGIVGVFVESGNAWNQAVESHSVFTITELLMDQASFLGGAGNRLGLGTMSALLVLTVLIVPLVQTMCLLYHWFAPMKKQTRRKMDVVLEGLEAWQYVEVYLVATLVATWQLGPISGFMINSYCGSLDDSFDMLVYYGILDPSDAQCFKVEASISSAAYMLATSAVLLVFLNTYIRNASRQYFRDIENKSKKGTQASEETAASPAHDHDDNISAVTGPGQSVAYPAGKDDTTAIESHSDELQPLRLVHEGGHFSDENEEMESVVDPLSKPVGDDAEENWQRSDAMVKIHPVPVLFTDKFRWTLRSRESGPVAGELPMKGDPYLAIDTDPTTGSRDSHSGESHPLLVSGDEPSAFPPLLVSGDEPSAFPPTPVQSSMDGDSTRDDFSLESGQRVFGDDADTFTDEVVKVKSLGVGWDSESENENNDEDHFSQGETVDMSLSTARVESVGMDDVSSTTSTSVLLGSGSVVSGPSSQSEESFRDEVASNDGASYLTDDEDIFESTQILQTSLREAEDGWRHGHSTAGYGGQSTSHSAVTRPQSNSQLQAALMQDVVL